MADREKIVVVHFIGDECTYCYENIIALEDDSAENFYLGFEDWVNALIRSAEELDSYPMGKYKIGNHIFDVSDFVSVVEKPFHDKSKGRKWEVEMPEVYTLDEWFEKNKVT
jgi:hypothetical protein